MPVVVVGAGPTGAIAAALLARQGVASLLVDRRATAYPLPRAVHFDDEAFRVFQALGLDGEVARISTPTRGLRLVDGRQRVLAQISRATAGRYGFPEANMFDQPELEAVLRAGVERQPAIVTRYGWELVGIEAAADGDEPPIRVLLRDRATGAMERLLTSAVLGCDGANSTTRGYVGASSRRLGRGQSWLVIDVRTSAELPVWQGVHQVCDPRRASTFMRVGPCRYRWEFELGDGEDTERLLSPAVLADLLGPWLPSAPAVQTSVLRAASYTYQSVVADRWRADRIFLLGDAAHQTPPFLGQGLCSGVRDAANLTWKLALVLDGRAQDRLLDTYQAERAPHARQVITLAGALGAAMTVRARVPAAARTAVVRSLFAIPGAGSLIARAGWPPLRPGPLVERRLRPSSWLAGRPCPQPLVQTAKGPVRLDEVLGTGFAVVSQDAIPTSGRAALDRLGTTYVHVVPTFQSPRTSSGSPGDVRVGDPARVLLRWLARGGAHAVLLRPDRTVTAAGRTADLVGWGQLLRRAGIG